MIIWRKERGYSQLGQRNCLPLRFEENCTGLLRIQVLGGASIGNVHFFDILLLSLRTKRQNNKVKLEGFDCSLTKVVEFSGSALKNQS